MREIFLSKYGRQYYDKVKVSLLTNDTSAIEKIAARLSRKQEIVRAFKEKYNIPAEKTIVAIGHSAHHIDNHLVIIEALKGLDRKKRNRVVLLFPLTYGYMRDNYKAEIANLCQSLHYDCVLIDTYLPYEENLDLRLASEIHIRMPKYDAFSSALNETISGENVIITGSWLPYGRLRLNDVRYFETDDYGKLPALLDHILDHYESAVEMHRGNAEKVIRMFQREDVANNFGEVLIEAGN